MTTRLFTCWHNPNSRDPFAQKVDLSKFKAVALVAIPKDIVKTEQALEHVYQAANSIDAPFWHNPGVMLLGGLEGARSLDVGDVVITDEGEAFQVAGCGFTKIDTPVCRGALHSFSPADAIALGSVPAVCYTTS